MDKLPETFYARAERHAPALLVELGARAFRALVDEANLPGSALKGGK